MTRRIWLVVLLLYGSAAAADGTYRVVEARRDSGRLTPGVFAVAFCAGLFWPIDLAARPLLKSG